LSNHFAQIILGTFVALLPLINPFAAAPTFLAMTEGDSPERRLEQLTKACFYMVGILVCFLTVGRFIMGFFGISLPGLRIAGGLLVAGIGWEMLMGSAEGAHAEHANPEAKAKPDISFSPLAMPMLSGPGSIAVTLGFTTLASGWLDYVAIVLGILAVAVLTYVVLRLSTKVVLVVGTNGMNALTKIMGFLLVCVGIQFVVNGVTAIVTAPEMLGVIRQALAR
jgi:multiple antibiotic resistance protein